MSLINETVELVLSKSPRELFALFWYFFVFEFTRYVLFDLIVLIKFLKNRSADFRRYEAARGMLFAERPLVSIISPGKNEGKRLSALVHSLTRQTYDHMEVIVVDDGSDDDTARICRRLVQEGYIDRFFSLRQRGGKASAANLGLQYCSGRFTVHLDADSHLEKDALERILVPFYMDSSLGAVGGDIRVSNTDSSLAARLQTIEYMKSISMGRTVNSTMGILRTISGAYGAFRTDILRRLHGWDPGPGLDGDITLKIRKMGFKVKHEPFAVCYTNVPVSFRSLAKQRFRWDRSLVRFRIRKHRDLFSLTSRNFRLADFLAVVDNVLYSFLFNFKWWVYILQVLVFHTDYMLLILTANYCLYTVCNILQFLMGCILYDRTLRRDEIACAIFLPFMPLYTGWFLRLVRTFAQVMELLYKASYLDRWNPWKVSRVARRTGL